MENIDIFSYILTKEQWNLIQALVGLLTFCSIFSLFMHFFIFKRLDVFVAKFGNIWSWSIVKAIAPPFAAFLWLSCSLFAVEIVRIEYEISVLSAIPTIISLMHVTVITWFLLRYIRLTKKNYVDKQTSINPNFDVTTSDLISKIFVITALVLGTMVAMEVLDLNIAGILAFGGIGGIAVAFAAQELIANFFGGLMIYMDKPFKVGDTIESSDMDILGTVTDIGWRQTVIKRFDSRLLYVPNSAFTKTSVINISRQTNRKIMEYLGIRYDDAQKLEEIVAEVLRMIKCHPEIDVDEGCIVNFSRFAPSSLDILIYCYTKTTDWTQYNAVKQDVLISAMDIVLAHGAEIAFPTSTVHIENVDGVEKAVPMQVESKI